MTTNDDHAAALQRRAARRSASAMLLVLLAACGGGGSSDDAPAPAPASSAATATCNLPDFRAALLERINRVRASGADCGVEGRFGAAPPLVWNDRLAEAADGHSKDMASRNFFSHTGSDGRTLADRIDAAGYVWRTIGENIAGGQRTVDVVMDGWIASDGHCANLLNPQFTEVGVACVLPGAGTTYATYWTMDLARPR